MHALTIEWGNDLPNKEHHAFLSDIEVGAHLCNSDQFAA